MPISRAFVLSLLAVRHDRRGHPFIFSIFSMLRTQPYERNPRASLRRKFNSMATPIQSDGSQLGVNLLHGMFVQTVMEDDGCLTMTAPGDQAFGAGVLNDGFGPFRHGDHKRSWQIHQVNAPNKDLLNGSIALRAGNEATIEELTIVLRYKVRNNQQLQKADNTMQQEDDKAFAVPVPVRSAKPATVSTTAVPPVTCQSPYLRCKEFSAEVSLAVLEKAANWETTSSSTSSSEENLNALWAAYGMNQERSTVVQRPFISVRYNIKIPDKLDMGETKKAAIFTNQHDFVLDDMVLLQHSVAAAIPSVASMDFEELRKCLSKCASGIFSKVACDDGTDGIFIIAKQNLGSQFLEKTNYELHVVTMTIDKSRFVNAIFPKQTFTKYTGFKKTDPSKTFDMTGLMNVAEVAFRNDEIEDAFGCIEGAFVTKVDLQYNGGRLWKTTCASRGHLNEISKDQENKLYEICKGHLSTKMTLPSRVDRLNRLCSSQLPQAKDFEPMSLV